MRAKPIRVEVTQDDIDKGVPGRMSLCPIARAIKRLGYEDVVVLSSLIQFSKTADHPYKVVPGGLIPPRVKRFITRFDDNETVKPFVFHIKNQLP